MLPECPFLLNCPGKLGIAVENGLGVGGLWLLLPFRRDRGWEELSIRELADRHHVHRPDGAAGGGVGVAPGAEDSGAGVPPGLEEHKPVIDGWLEEDWMPRASSAYRPAGADPAGR